MTDLSFYTLRRANTLRLPQFKNSKGEPAHSRPDGSDWSLGEWMNALLGELGETANLVKKVKRGDISLDNARDELGNELADVVTYADLTMHQMKLPLVEYWSSFGSLRCYAKLSSANFSLGEMMNCAFAGFGKAADSIAKNGHEEGYRPGYGVNGGFLQGMVAIDRAAHKIDVDLGYATLKKFNEVSRRVGANVFIQPEDRLVDRDGVSL